ncbi:MAG: hypothetical protein ACRENL_06620 [Candidatus Dormibacteria bacterium]
MSKHVASDEPYLLIEEVAERLGLPLSVLLHRVEAGDIPARRIETDEGVHYALRLGDLGIELDDEGLPASAMGDDADAYEGSAGYDNGEVDEESTLTAVFEQDDDPSPSVARAIVSAFNSGPQTLPHQPLPRDLDVTGRRVGSEEAVDGGATAESVTPEPGSVEPAEEEDLPPPAWTVRPREPQEPPIWLTPAARERAEAPGALEDEDVDDGAISASAGIRAVREDVPAEPFSSASEPGAEEDDPDVGSPVAELGVPRAAPDSQLGIVEAGAQGPRGDLASMSLDARELVAGLLDRWERTLEQRIYTEQRQRFQAELVARQNMVKQLQMELHAARAEHAAAQAEKDRLLAGKERELADRERDLAETRRLAHEAERMIPPAAARRRRWFWSRDA